MQSVVVLKYFQAAGACLLIYVAFLGWGWALCRFLRLKAQIDISMMAALGMAASALVGGGLSLAGIIGPTLARSYILIGAMISAVWGIYNRKIISQCLTTCVGRIKKNPVILLLFFSAAALLTITIVHSSVLAFNVHDDFQGYLVFPKKILQTGALGSDPFSERRMCALGGQSFLQALMLSLLDLRYINILDKGLGWLTFVMLVCGHSIKRNLGPQFWLSFIIVLQFVSMPVANTSSSVTGMALFLALMLAVSIYWAEPYAPSIILPAILAAGLCSLKSSHLVGSGILVFAAWLFAGPREFGKKIRGFFCFGAITALLLLPWMVEMFLSSGTFLYPIFGKGYHGSAYGPFPSVSSLETSWPWILGALRFVFFSPGSIIGFLLIAYIIAKKSLDPPDRRINVIIFLATWISVFLMTWSSGIGRYSVPILMSCIVFLFVEFFADPLPSQKTTSLDKYKATKVLLLLIFFFAFCWPNGVQKKLRQIISLSRPSTMWTIAEIEQYENLQKSIPPGVSILARVSKPFLFDFQRNQVFVIDWPGGASIPPGIPLSGNDRQLVDYLRSKAIRFIVYSYADEAGYPYAKYKERLNWKFGYFKRVRDLTFYTFLFHRKLMDLAKFFTKTYDDGQIFVLDLAQPKI
jgi:hypothetical protein